MVEYFLTENLLGHFNQILQQRSNRRGNVAMQVGQARRRLRRQGCAVVEWVHACMHRRRQSRALVA